MNSTNQSTGILSKEITEVNFINLANNMIGTGLLLTGKANYELAKEYAQQQERVTAIAFAEWTEREDYTLIFETNLWGTIGNPNNFTTEQLYELYLNQTNQ